MQALVHWAIVWHCCPVFLGHPCSGAHCSHGWRDGLSVLTHRSRRVVSQKDPQRCMEARKRPCPERSRFSPTQAFLPRLQPAGLLETAGIYSRRVLSQEFHLSCHLHCAQSVGSVSNYTNYENSSRTAIKLARHCSKNTALHYEQKDWPERTGYETGSHNIKNEPLEDPMKVLLPPLHNKLGHIK